MAERVIQIKRGITTETPGDTLAVGELAFSYSSRRLFIGNAAGSGNAPVILIDLDADVVIDGGTF